MNHRKNGALKYLSMVRCINSNANLAALINAFRVSDQSHEQWYGEQKIAKEMVKEQLEQHFEFGLQYLNLAYSVVGGFNFKLKEFTKKKEPWWPSIFNMFGKKDFDILNLKMSYLNKNDMEILSNCLYNEIENFKLPQTHIRVLDLSRNAIMKDGAKTLATALEKNKSL